MNVVSWTGTNGFWAFWAARNPGISTFLYMHGPSLLGHWYPARALLRTSFSPDLPFRVLMSYSAGYDCVDGFTKGWD